jgi:enoyl-CoA hydratase
MAKVNALSLSMLSAINSALDRAEADRAVVLLTGRPGSSRPVCGEMLISLKNQQFATSHVPVGSKLTLRLTIGYQFD